MESLEELLKKHKVMDLNTIRERKRTLNKKRFPSEMWFERHLVASKVRGYRRNVCLESRFFGDFVFRTSKLVVEIDGSSHNGKRDYDESRDCLLTHFGYTVIRVRHNNKQDLVDAIKYIKANQHVKAKPILIQKQIVKKSKTQLAKLRNMKELTDYFEAKARHTATIAKRKARTTFIIRKELKS